MTSCVRRLLWFSALYTASIVTFAFIVLSVRGLLQALQLAMS